MEKWHAQGKKLSSLIRPATFPIAVTLLKKSSAFPEDIKRPLSDLGIKVSICQALSMVRRYGWTVGMTEEDSINCAGKVVLGWRAPDDEEVLLNGWVQAGLVENAKAAQETFDSIYKLRDGDHEGLLMSPLDQTTIEPDIIMIYCNPAQTMLLLHATIYKSGGRPSFSSQTAFGSCSDGIAQTILTGKANVVLPGIGDRLISMAKEDELIFTIPVSMLDIVLEGLEAASEKGMMRYPLPIHLAYQFKLPWE